MSNQALAENPLDLLLWRAADLHRQGKWLYAAQIYRQINEEYPDHAPAWVYLAELYISRGQYRAARDVLKNGLIECADDIRLNLTLGNVYLEEGDFDRAVACYRTVLNEDRGHPKALHNIGLAFARTGRNAEAIAYLTKLAYSRPDYPGLAELLGGTYLAVGQIDRALNVLLPAEERDPDNALLRYLAGIAFAGMERWAEATQRLRRANALKPDDAETMRALGWALLKLRNHEEAEVWLRRAVDVRPDFLFAHMNLAVLYLMSDRPDEGWEALEQVRRLDPENERLAAFMDRWNEDGEVPDIAAIEGTYGTRRTT